MKHILRIFIILLLSVGCHRPTHQNVVGIWELDGGAVILREDRSAAVSSNHQIGTWSLEDGMLILDLDKPVVARKEFRIISLKRHQLMVLGVDLGEGTEGRINLNYVGPPHPLFVD